MPERQAPLRQSFVAEAAAPVPRADAPTAPVESALGSAYRVYDQYVEEGRQYAAGQSAWYNRQTKPSAQLGGALPGGMSPLAVVTRALESAAPIPREVLAPWVDLVAKLVPSIAAELARLGSPPRSATAEAQRSPQPAWRPWFDGSPRTDPGIAISRATARPSVATGGAKLSGASTGASARESAGTAARGGSGPATPIGVQLDDDDVGVVLGPRVSSIVTQPTPRRHVPGGSAQANDREMRTTIAASDLQPRRPNTGSSWG